MPVAVTVAVDEPEFALLNTAVLGPDTCVHVPIPTTGVFPPSDVLVKDPHTFCVPPVVAVLGVA